MAFRYRLTTFAGERASWLRASIAFIVIGVTWWLMFADGVVPSEWDAVFLLVIGYYFNDRPAERAAYLVERLGPSDDEVNALDHAAIVELGWQFGLAFILVLGAFFAFLLPHVRLTIPGSWIGAAALGVGFYFKESDLPDAQPYHHALRIILAGLVTVLTIPLAFYVETPAHKATIPLQWVGLVFVVVAFYFKERRTVSRGA
jgi:hypothetical protein